MATGRAAMAGLTALLALALAGAATAAQPAVTPLPLPLGAQGEVFRSIDEQGTVTFSQTPPAGRAWKLVELKPLAGTVDTAPRPPSVQPAAAAADAPKKAAPERSPAPRGGERAPRGMSLETFNLLRRGMSEGEVIVRAGPPDHERIETLVGVIHKTWYYMPTAANPWMTIIRLRGGIVIETERVRRL
jgi:hypothetical protein